MSWKYLMGVLEVFDGYPLDIAWVSSRYFMGSLKLVHSFPEIYHSFPGDIS